MNKTGYISLALISAILVLVLLAYLRRKGIIASGPGAFLPGPYKSGEPGPVSCYKRLKMGTKGEEVRILQGWINRNTEDNKYSIEEDGIFGPKTESALRQVAIEVYGFAITSTSLHEIPALREHCT